MGALPRPDFPPGPQRDLVDALHDLHHRAGWPSLRTLARDAGCSHTTVSAVFSSPKLPTWGVLELLVEAMDGDVEQFRRLWVAAELPGAARACDACRSPAGSEELAVVRRHLETGTGLLLVTGEAGIGKTHLVRVATAAVAGEVFVATGSCLPLSTAVPLLPVADVLRVVHAADGGQWVKDALTDTPPYVTGSLGQLLPEISAELPAQVSDTDFARHRLFHAVGTTLAALARIRRFAVLIEDLHWADASTLDLLEHLLTALDQVPVVGTWRTEDPSVAEVNADWWVRVRRTSLVTSLELPPLSRAETREQLAQLSGRDPEAGFVDRLHERSRGQPLFTEQLAAQADTDLPLPSLLADLLDARLGDLTGSAWSAALALGVADRPLTSPLLARATRLAEADLAAGLHHTRRLPASGPRRPATRRRCDIRCSPRLSADGSSPVRRRQRMNGWPWPSRRPRTRRPPRSPSTGRAPATQNRNSRGGSAQQGRRTSGSPGVRRPSSGCGSSTCGPTAPQRPAIHPSVATTPSCP